MQRRKKLLFWRLGNRLKQKDISRTLGISLGHYSNIERGVTDPSFEILMRFRKHYSVKDVLGLFEKGDSSNGDNNPTRAVH